MVPAMASARKRSDKKIEGDFSGLTMSAFFLKLEKQVPYKFYFDAGQLDSFTVQIIAHGQTFPELLKEAFKGTDIHFSIDPDRNVFIVRKLAIVTSLPKGFHGSFSKFGQCIR